MRSSKEKSPFYSSELLMIKEGKRLKEVLPLEEIPVIILCGGWGSRIKDITGDVFSKSLIPIDKARLVLDYPLDLLREAGIRRIILATSMPDIDILRKNFPQDSFSNIEYSVQRFPIGVVEAVNQVIWEKDLNQSPFFLIHGDEIVLGVSLKDMYYQHVIIRAPITEVLTDYPEAGDNYVMWFDRDHRVTKILRHPSTFERKGGATATGMFIFSSGVFERYGNCSSWEEVLFSASRVGDLFVHLIHGEFFNINTPTELDVARTRLLGHKVLRHNISPPS